MSDRLAQSRPLWSGYSGRWLRWAEIFLDSHAFVIVETDMRSDNRREWCSVPWSDEQILDDGFGAARRDLTPPR